MPVIDFGEPATAEALALAVPPVPRETTCAVVYERFVQAPREPAVVVVDQESRPLGLVSRQTALARYAERYGPELYGRKPIEFMMDAQPLIIDKSTSINELGRQVAIDHPTALVNGFIVTSEGRYLGVGTGQALIRYKVERDARRTVELQEALTESARARKAMSEFLAMMSHELRTPLNAIIGFSDILQREQFGPIGLTRYIDYARDIHGAGIHLLSLISDILDLSKAEAGRLELHLELVQPTATIENAIRLMTERAFVAGISIKNGVPAELPVLNVDELKLKQMLLNLLSNAVKFTPAGGAVQVSARMERGELLIQIADNGIGIAEQDIPKALAAFGQVDSAIARKTSGTGLGLPLVKTLMELHGGRFVLESAVGVGTTATMIFPPERLRQSNAAGWSAG